jgi:hypothetical protein
MGLSVLYSSKQLKEKNFLSQVSVLEVICDTNVHLFCIYNVHQDSILGANTFTYNFFGKEMLKFSFGVKI